MQTKYITKGGNAMSAKYNNPGRVDVERAAESIMSNPSGGGITSRQENGYIHNTAYSKEPGGKRLSWDEYPNGDIKNVHSSRNGSSYTQYKDS